MIGGLDDDLVLVQVLLPRFDRVDKDSLGETLSRSRRERRTDEADLGQIRAFALEDVEDFPGLVLVVLDVVPNGPIERSKEPRLKYVSS